MRSGTIAFLMGVLFLNSLASLPTVKQYLFVVLFFLGFFCLWHCIPVTRKISVRQELFTTAFFFLLGLIWTGIFAAVRLHHSLPEELEIKKINAIGVIAS